MTEAIAAAELKGSRLSVETVTTVEGVAELAPLYEPLLRSISNTLPFLLHDWHLIWCRHFLNSNPRIRDEPLFCVVRNSENLCVGIVPFVVSRRRVGFVKIMSVNLIGADPAITEIRRPIINPAYEQEVARSVQEHLRKLGHWDWVHWAGISDGVGESLAKTGALQPQSLLLDYVLDLPSSWELFRQGLKRNVRESLRHCYNSLKRDNHAFELHVIKEPTEMRAGLDTFLKLHVMRAEVTSGRKHPNRFASAVSRNFLYEICERLAARDAVRLFQLKIDSNVVATLTGFVVGGSLYFYYSGFDPSWSKYSVMTTTVAEAMKYAIANGLKTVHLSPSRDVSKTRWGPREVPYSAAYIHGHGWRGRLVLKAYLRARGAQGLPAWVLDRLFARRVWR